jgi:hypothetical protein
VESNSTNYFEPFPLVKVVVASKIETDDAALSDFDYLDNPPLTKAELKEQEEKDRLEEQEREILGRRRSVLKGNSALSKVESQMSRKVEEKTHTLRDGTPEL